MAGLGRTGRGGLDAVLHRTDLGRPASGLPSAHGPDARDGAPGPAGDRDPAWAAARCRLSVDVPFPQRPERLPHLGLGLGVAW